MAGWKIVIATGEGEVVEQIDGSEWDNCIPIELGSLGKVAFLEEVSTAIRRAVYR